jgi:hypothetical protein
VIETLVLAMAFSFLGVALAIIIVLVLDPQWLQDKPHPDEQRYRQHQPSRVVQAAPEREDVKA